MKLTLKLEGERVVSGGYSLSSKTEPYTVAEVDIEGTAQFVAESLRSLADSVYQPAALAMSIGQFEYDGEQIHRALKRYKLERGLR